MTMPLFELHAAGTPVPSVTRPDRRRTVDPQAAAAVMRAAGLEPLEPYPGSSKPWRCTHTRCLREVTPRYSNIAKGQNGCVHCAGRYTDPRAAEEIMRAAGLEPLEPYPGTSKPWRCRHVPCGREVTPWYSHVRTGHGGCLFCRKGAPVTAEDAKREMREAGMEPLEPFHGLDTKWRSRCLTCGTVGEPRLTSIRHGQGGCRPCGRRKANASLRGDAHQAIARMRDAGLEPLAPYPGTGEPYKARCARCDAIVYPRLQKARPPACRYCVSKARGKAQRHDSTEAEAKMRALGLEPQESYQGIKYPWRCVCTGCGRTTSPTYRSILAGQSGCRRCADLRAAVARREDPHKAAASMREAGFEPLDPYQTSMTPWLCRHTVCGQESRPTLAKVRSGGGCRYCARYGFQRGEPARVYVVVHRKLSAVKIGVAGAEQRNNDRITQHRRYGFELHSQYPVTTGDDALAVEQAIIRRLRAEGHEPYLTIQQLPNGWTETFDAALVSPECLDALIHAERKRVTAARCSNGLSQGAMISDTGHPDEDATVV
ncbi:hypothetical protein [Micromonospora sp. U21]|uniref:hypothetical protein n=1 Tax=Micromonospora sp. U21 TaxID=2824899 RepID=UPI001B375C65|nr:hypothetical protein [Micromonospora sp. U21]MBQ0905024.1 hypothetical protein [Micromonospora sp. U21]